MRLSKKEPAVDFDDIPLANVGFGPKVSDARPIGMGTSNPSSPTTDVGAVIGSKIKLKGELSGDEDLLIQGQFEGTINLSGHHLTVGVEGETKAKIKVKSITIEGKVEGEVEASELISVKDKSYVNGQLKADRVNLEDGAKFRGGIEMADKS